MAHSIGRRRVLAGAGAAILVGTLEGCRAPALRPTRIPSPAGRLQLLPLHADVSRITAITVCTRPFRPRGPRLDVERLGDKTIVHNYGHGGSGWSLSWGSSSIATDLIYQNVSFVPRRDGLVFQVIGENDYYGFGDDTTVPDRAEAELAVSTIAALYA